MTDTEKILRFARFTVCKHIRCGEVFYFQWSDPNGEHCAEPDTTDLTWLFKWCVPQIKGSIPGVGRFGDIWKGISFDYLGDGTIICEIEVANINDSGHAGMSEGRGKTEGEALRAAIVALIESND